MKRPDGRSTPLGLRDHVFGLDVLQQADGSARLVAGRSEVLVSLMGPMAVKAKQELPDRACLQVTVQTLSAPPSRTLRWTTSALIDICLGIEETAVAVRIKQILDEMILSQLHPRTLISLVVQPIRTDGSGVAHMLNGCVAALIDGAVPMRTTVLAVSGCRMASGQIVLDPSAAEEKEATSARFFFVFDIQKDSHTPVQAEIIGDMDGADLDELHRTCWAAAKDIGKELRKTVRGRLQP